MFIFGEKQLFVDSLGLKEATYIQKEDLGDGYSMWQPVKQIMPNVYLKQDRKFIELTKNFIPFEAK